MSSGAVDTILLLLLGTFAGGLCAGIAQLGDDKVVAGEKLKLVWQDEFNEAEGMRTFGPDEDGVWEGVNMWYSGTWDDEVYKPGQAEVADGRLKISLTDTPGWDLQHRRMHKFTSAMLQSWNKQCYTGGYFEVRAKQPGNVHKGGQWSAVWMAGNLGRPGYLSSTHGLWPYSLDQCDGSERSQVGLDDGTWLEGQRITACNQAPGFGLNPGQGRGMPEFDVLEVSVPTNGVSSGEKVHLTASLQMGPLIPKDTNFGPGLTGCAGDPRDGTLYESCESFTYFRNQSLHVKPAHWCMVVDYNANIGLWDRASALQDCLSAEVQLEETHFEEYHTYGLLWEPQDRMIWYVDGNPVYEVKQSALEPKQSPSNPNFYVGQRDIPTEPMSLILNLAISDGGFQQWHRGHEWPLEFEVDYVRLYQDQTDRGHSLGCSPDSHPTAAYIAEHREVYGLGVCGNGKCEDGECSKCPGDCVGNMGCPGSHVDGKPTKADGWEIAHAADTCPGTCGTVMGGQPLGCCLTGDCCTFMAGQPIGCAIGHCGADEGCQLSFTQEGMRIKASGDRPCLVRRTGLLPEGPLQDTKHFDFGLGLEVSGSGSFSYAVTIGPSGTMCDPAHFDCKAILVKVDPDETALCANCEGTGEAPGHLHQHLGHIDLSFRFPFFLGSKGGALKITAQPGADLLFKHVRFGPFAPIPSAVALSITRRGYWSTQAACGAVAAGVSCDAAQNCHPCGDRLAWLTSPSGGGMTDEVGRSTLASEYPAQCGACDSSTIKSFDIHAAAATGVFSTQAPVAAPTHDPAPTPAPTTIATQVPTESASPTPSPVQATTPAPTPAATRDPIAFPTDSPTVPAPMLAATPAPTPAAAPAPTPAAFLAPTPAATPAPTPATMPVTTPAAFLSTAALTTDSPSATPTAANPKVPVAACSAHAGCSGLWGDCCPTPNGHLLGCCEQSGPEQESGSEQVSSARCEAHTACSGLIGDCCPTAAGLMLGCCSS